MPASKEIDGVNALTLKWLELPYAIPADPGVASAPLAARWSDQGISRRASWCIWNARPSIWTYGYLSSVTAR